MTQEPPPPAEEGINLVRGFLGAAAGGVLGIFAFGWIAHQGFYALVLPGALLGLGANLASRRTSRVLPVACAALAFPVGLVAEWRTFPFVTDPGLGYFVGHLNDLRPMTWIMIVIGSFLGFRIARREPRRSAQPQTGA